MIEKSTFEIILPYWINDLWPGRKSKIEPLSHMTYLGGFDESIYEKYTPSFFIAIEDDKIVGVNSGHRTSTTSFRSRGIWVDPNYRNRGISQKLFTAIKETAIKENCDKIWSAPRKSSLSVYENFGFIRTSDFFDKNMEFGPNCYVLMEI
tara:strand:+ start:230 stop:679 length:450 start_codon:yes stop_codon:yes gene_type:complete